MEAIITNLITWLATGIDFVTGIIIGFAALEATVKTIMLYFPYRKNMDDSKERIRLSLGKSLTLSLEFALAADILRSAIAPTWDEIGKLAAIIALRTILNYFLSKEIEQATKKKTGNAFGLEK
ncbi:MAG: DUF1622 domain-containing protein [Pelatocladus maniniholoensis HA4357-MV3]|jgi:uncharacterized membrane protein|uniref:DUF1622 domain-containing protein n=1 Tax=Pelatocladus maniniholoensis HA4357-MV3 TaxID=1117104 RepID=A0A9E3HBV4_9NOST|nr:DUF1622 domain-containing protein [Pelatocladus maniniholoensis HA4357-MV3]BAZ69846.1 hypothetical protein NIES4106_46260 [Fischerella sp. NIES-4106]